VTELIRLLCPKCVLLVGVAGGKHSHFEHGDVGYSTSLVYSTYGKVTQTGLRATLEAIAVSGSDKSLVAGSMLRELSAVEQLALGFLNSNGELDLWRLDEVKAHRVHSVVDGHFIVRLLKR